MGVNTTIAITASQQQTRHVRGGQGILQSLLLPILSCLCLKYYLYYHMT